MSFIPFLLFLLPLAKSLESYRQLLNTLYVPVDILGVGNDTEENHAPSPCPLRLQLPFLAQPIIMISTWVLRSIKDKN